MYVDDIVGVLVYFGLCTVGKEVPTDSHEIFDEGGMGLKRLAIILRHVWN